MRGRKRVCKGVGERGWKERRGLESVNRVH